MLNSAKKFGPFYFILLEKVWKILKIFYEWAILVAPRLIKFISPYRACTRAVQSRRKQAAAAADYLPALTGTKLRTRTSNKLSRIRNGRA